MRRVDTCLTLLLALGALSAVGAARAASGDFDVVADERMPTPPPSGAGRVVAYSCEDGSSLEVTFGGQVATVSEPDKPPVDLFPAPAGVGARYISDAAMLDVRGDAIVWENGNTPPRHCMRR